MKGGDRHMQKTVQPTDLGLLSDRGTIYPPVDHQGSLHSLEDQGEVGCIPSHPLARCRGQVGNRPTDISVLQLFLLQQFDPNPPQKPPLEHRVHLAVLVLLVLPLPWHKPGFKPSSGRTRSLRTTHMAFILLERCQHIALKYHQKKKKSTWEREFDIGSCQRQYKKKKKNHLMWGSIENNDRNLLKAGSCTCRSQVPAKEWHNLGRIVAPLNRRVEQCPHRYLKILNAFNSYYSWCYRCL